ncbi:MAG: Coenzyme F420 hydrogenase/dehydrogenase, beta subunit C-terminal domain [Chloroflexota bacterium]
MNQAEQLSNIVQNGLCIGCGLCQSIAGPERVQVMMTPEGRERPVESAAIDAATGAHIAAVCPGVQIAGLPSSLMEPETVVDPIWGPYLFTAQNSAQPDAFNEDRDAPLSSPLDETSVLLNRGIVRSYASDPEVRFKGATGGVLTALAIFLLETGAVNFVLHVAASQQQPMRSERQLSFDRGQVLGAAGSRYGPAAPLVDFLEILEREEPFAFVGKPCDVGAIRNLARLDPRVDQYCLYCLTLVCGGASELSKSRDLLDEFGVTEEKLALLRYRGHGNPGLTRVETKDGRAFEKSYNDMWEDEAGWHLQFRCKICPDAIGEAADLVACDIWPDAAPAGEDEGFNGIIVRTQKGADLLTAAVNHGALIVDQAFTPRDLDHFQPHQVRKKKAVWARIEGLRQAGQLAPTISDLRIEELAMENDPGVNLRETEGTLQRAQEGRTSEPAARPE